MKANNLTISLPNKGCDKNCPYCISKLTFTPTKNEGAFHENLQKVKTFANACGVSSILITGKGEPTLNFDALTEVSSFFKDYPIELQTNGKRLMSIFEYDSPHCLEYICHIDVIAFSIDDINQLLLYKPLIEYIHNIGKLVRVVFLINDHSVKMLKHNLEVIATCTDLKVDQLTFRLVTIPEYIFEYNESSYKVIDWIKENVTQIATNYYNAANTYIKHVGYFIRKLNFGPSVYDVSGLSCTAHNACIQDHADEDDLRSLIYLEDGHLYTSWNSKASILF